MTHGETCRPWESCESVHGRSLSFLDTDPRRPSSCEWNCLESTRMIGVAPQLVWPQVSRQPHAESRDHAPGVRCLECPATPATLTSRLDPLARPVIRSGQVSPVVRRQRSHRAGRRAILQWRKARILIPGGLVSKRPYQPATLPLRIVPPP